jgi:hypothetical protein
MERSKLSRYLIIGLVLINISMMVFMIVRPGKPRGPHDGPPRGEGPKQIIIERLHLDARQQEKYSALVEEHRAKLFALNDSSKAMHDHLYNYLKTEPVDEMHVDSVIAMIADNQYQLEYLNFNHFKDIKAICRADQQDEFKELVNDLGILFSPKGPPKRR